MNLSYFFNDNRTIDSDSLGAVAFVRWSLFVSCLCVLFLVIYWLRCPFSFFSNRTYPYPNWMVFICCFCVPSVIFWASAPLKESLIIFGLGTLLFGIHGVKERVNTQSILWLTVGLLTLLSLKIYILLALLPGLWFWLTSTSKSKRAFQMKYLWIHFLLAC